MNKEFQGKVVDIKSIAQGIFKIQMQLKTMPDKIIPGQFLNVKIPNGKFLLRRPLGICDFNYAEKTVDFCFQVKGGGTKALSEIEKGTVLDVLLPLGNGFLDAQGKKVMVIGGGIGAFPLLTVVKNNKNCYSFLGFKTKEAAVLTDEFKKASKETFIATDDGTAGEKGFITNIAMREFNRIKPDIVFACGPTPMFLAMREVFKDVSVPVYVSLEERMSCGFGACLCCTCKIQKGSEVKALRVCCEGPVFLLSEVVL